MDFLLGGETKLEMEQGWTSEGAKIAFAKFPGLVNLLLSMLEEGWSDNIVDVDGIVGTIEKLFPALDIIRRAGVPTENREIVFMNVANHLGSHVWQVRDLAARAICALTPNTNWQLSAEQLMVLKDGSTNLEHGILLAIQYRFEREIGVVIPNENLEGNSSVHLSSLFIKLKPHRLPSANERVLP